MRILVTGANGFIGKNLVMELKSRGYNNLVLCDADSVPADFKPEEGEESFEYHLSASDYTKAAMKSCDKAGKVKSYTYALPAVFGRWSEPGKGDIVANYCHDVANDISLVVKEPAQELRMVYIDDVVKTFADAMEGKKCPADGETVTLEVTHHVTVGMLAELLYSFRAMRKSGVISSGANAKAYWLKVPNMADLFIKRLYSTYLSYLPEENFACKLMMIDEQRGSLTEFLKTDDRGQIVIDITKPGATKGNHWHGTKTERYLVVSGEAIIRLRRVVSDDANQPGRIIEYKVSGDKLTSIDIPPGYTHNMTNIGDTDLVALIWANELFDYEHPDSHYQSV